MSFTTRSTLDLEHVPKGIVLRIVRPQVGDTIDLPLLSVKLQPDKSRGFSLIPRQISSYEKGKHYEVGRAGGLKVSCEVTLCRVSFVSVVNSSPMQNNHSKAAVGL